MSYQFLLLDLDNTLYPRESGLLKHIDYRIERYLSEKLKLGYRELCQVRQDYWCRYGTTLGGLILHHQVDPDEYLKFAYDIKIADFLKKDNQLYQTLESIDIPKCVFSNSPSFYVEQVLNTLGIRELISKIYDIQFLDFFGKPNPSSYLQVHNDLQVSGEDCILVDDFLVNIKGAEIAGLTPIWLTDSLEEDSVKWRIKEIYELPAVIGKLVGNKMSA